MSLAVRVFAVTLLVSTACSPAKSQQPPQYGSSASTAPPLQAPAAPAEAFTCVQILRCSATCGVDAPCLDACQQRGDQTAQAQMNAVIDCTTRCNNDPGCIHTSCQTELATCQGTGGTVASSPPSATLAQPHSTENLLPWMTGEWTASNYQFVFNADGTVRRGVSVALGGGCASTTNAVGPVTQEGDVLIMDFGPETARSCNTPVEGGPAQRVRYRIEWVRVPDYSQGLSSPDKIQLRLRELDCTKGGDLYCLEYMTRR